MAEDCKGFRGWNDLKECYAVSQPSNEQKERRRWYEKMASNGDPKGLKGKRVEAWDQAKVNRDLLNMAEIFGAKADQTAAMVNPLMERLRANDVRMGGA